ncbi:MAG: hypothetical protein KJ072_22500 [Verrucomicrobia bacterium]|nr:hypothetical protein [Verrucomicrobiota bacterium]
MRLLEQQAAALDIASPHELARQLVVDSLREAPQWSYLAGIIQQLREDVATATEALLTKAGKVSSQDAHKWVAETFQAHALDIESDQDRLA